MPDNWQWRAFYSDGTSLPEFDSRHHSFTEVDLERCVRVRLEPTLMPLPPYELRLEEGERPVFFRRRYVTFGDGSEVERTLHVLGIEGKLYLSISEDGGVVLSRGVAE